MLIVEDLFLLLMDADGDPAVPGMPRTTGLNAALIADLQLAGRVQLSDEKWPRVQTLRAGPTGSPVLDLGQEKLATRNGRRLDKLLWWSRLDPEQAVVDSLVRSRTLGVEEARGRGRARLPQLDPEPERRLRARLAEVLTGRSAPTVADATILAILESLDVVVPLLHRESGASTRPELRQRLAAVLDQPAAAGSPLIRTVRTFRLVTPTIPRNPIA